MEGSRRSISIEPLLKSVWTSALLSGGVDNRRSPATPLPARSAATSSALKPGVPRLGRVGHARGRAIADICPTPPIDRVIHSLPLPNASQVPTLQRAPCHNRRVTSSALRAFAARGAASAQKMPGNLTASRARSSARSLRCLPRSGRAAPPLGQAGQQARLGEPQAGDRRAISAIRCARRRDCCTRSRRATAPGVGPRALACPGAAGGAAPCVPLAAERALGEPRALSACGRETLVEIALPRLASTTNRISPLQRSAQLFDRSYRRPAGARSRAQLPPVNPRPIST